ncbi:MAG: asparagine synthetase B, partial [Myxococcaceae bacterium]
MCGFTGFWDFKVELSRADSLQIVREMSLQIEHRGPDSQGLWCDESVGVVLGHQRLAIVDLSPAGHQPMISSSGRSVLVYNGEIFNTAELRSELIAQGIMFRSTSDTEVILEGCEYWGVEGTCERLIGMFAFAFWDRKTRELTLVRDRLGVKPLYWGFQGQTLFFGSQIKSFTKHPDWNPEIDPEAQEAYFRTNYIPAQMSIYSGIYKLKPGYFLRINSNQKVIETCFWNLKKLNQVQIENPVE